MPETLPTLRARSPRARLRARTFRGHSLPLLLLLCAFACGGRDPLQEALRLQAQGDYEASIEPLRALLAETPDDPQVNYLYGRALTVAGQPSLAEWALRKAAEDPEWLTPAGTQLAASALNTGNFDTVIELTTRVLAAEPEHVDAMLIRAQAYARSRLHSEEALAEVERILAIDPVNTDAMEPRILALLTLERIEEAEQAIDELGRMIEENPDSGEWIRGWHCATTALFAADSGEPEVARERWEACLEKFPAHANVVSNALKYFDDQGDYARSLELLRAALAAEPASLDMRRRLALRTQYQLGVEEAEKLLIEGTELAEPRYKPAAYQILGKHYQDIGRHADAAATMKRAVETARELGVEVMPQLLFDYADALVLLGDHEGALAVAEEMTLAPHREMIRARVAQEKSDHLAALEHYEEAFRLWPDNPWARYLAARSAEAVGQFDRAVELYRYAIRIDADATDARYRLARLLIAQGNPTEGLAMLRVDWANSPANLDEQLLALELSTWAGDQAGVTELLKGLSQYGVVAYGRGLAALGSGANRRFGAEVATQVLERYRASDLSLQDPNRPVALLELIALHDSAGTSKNLETVVRKAVADQPEAAGTHSALGLWLEHSAAPSGEVRAAYERALELDAEDPVALAGLARLGAESDPAAAIALFDRAAAADPSDPSAALEAAKLARSAGRSEEAASRLAALLRDHATCVEAAMLLAELQLETGAPTAETAALAERAVRFQGGAPALDLLARVYRARNEPERATEAEARARSLRNATKPEATPPA